MDTVDPQSHPVERENCACPMGCPAGEETVLTGHDRIQHLPGDFTVVRCRTCGLMRTNPRPTARAMGFYYPDDYGPYLGTQVTAPSAPRARRFPALRKWVSRLLDSRSMFLPPLPRGRMLEMGCASGYFLEKMARDGWQVEGMEFSPRAAATARALGHQVYAGSMESAPAPAQPCDLIVGWMVLEHLHDPLAVLRKLADWSTPGAHLAISVPNAGSWDFRAFRSRWYMLHLPNHLYHFTPRTLRALLDKAGWEITDVHGQRVITDPLASFGYLLEDWGLVRLGRFLASLPARPGRWVWLLFPLAWPASILAQTARMTVWARKKAFLKKDPT